MSVKHALLALLMEQERYGYELKQELEQRTGGSWTVNIGQVYTTLDRLERDGMVVRQGADDEGRIAYAVTRAGIVEAKAWFDAPLEVAGPTRNALTMKLALALDNQDLNLRQIVHAQRMATMSQLHAATKKKRELTDPSPADQITLEHAIFSADAELRWLDFTEALVTRTAAHPRKES